MNENLDIDVKLLRPFTRFIYTIGELPTSYLMSMTYEEQLIWLCNYLSQTVIPTINNNGEAVKEVQNLVTELQEYINNYFDNLDVQEEINNKLDDMAESGELAEIINEEIFNELNTQVETNTNAITGLTTDVESNTDNIEVLTSEKVLLIGDSYLKGYNGTEDVNSWGYYFKQYAKISNNDYQELYESGCGLVHLGGQGHTFKTLLEANINNITDKNLIKSVIICGGINDHSEIQSDIENAIGLLVTYINSVIPNAKVYMGCISIYSQNESSGNSIRKDMIDQVYPAWFNAPKYGAIYLNGVENVGHDYNNKGTDNAHMSQNGYIEVGKAVAEAWKSGSYNYYRIHNDNHTEINIGGDITGSSLKLTIAGYILGNIKQITIGALNINDLTAWNPASNVLEISDDYALENFPLIRQIFTKQPQFRMQVLVTSSTSSKTGVYNCYLTFTNKGALQLNFDVALNFEITAIRLYTNTYLIPTLLS